MVKRSFAFIAIVGTVLVLYFAIAAARRATLIGRLPSIPTAAAQSAAISTHLINSDRNAREHPGSAEAVGNLAIAYHADMFYDEAARLYSAAAALDPSAWRWNYYAALVEDTRGNAAAATSQLRRVVEKAPDLAEGWWRLGEAEFKAGEYDAAEKDFRRAMSLTDPPPENTRVMSSVRPAPTSAYAALGLARLTIVRGDARSAQELLETVVQKNPQFGPAFRLLGAAYSALGRDADAKRAVQKADRLPGYDPYVGPMMDRLALESSNSTFLLQQAASADVNINAAWREYLIRRAIEVDPKNADAIYELASLLRVQRRFDEALKLLQQHQLLVPDDFQAVADIGRCLAGLQRFPEAEAALRKAVAVLDDANTRYDLGFVLDRTGRVPEAIAEYRKALAHNPNHHDALNNLGVALARLGQVRQAAIEFERLVALDPDNADAHTNLGAMLLAEGARDRAAAEFRSALEIDPQHARARDALARATSH